eukprot:05917.XXX_130170_130325_1 [CDS] Oithona nana genome sequencing.
MTLLDLGFVVCPPAITKMVEPLCSKLEQPASNLLVGKLGPLVHCKVFRFKK